MSSSPSVPHSSVNLLTNRRVPLRLLVDEVSNAPKEVGGGAPCLGFCPNQVTASNQSEDSQHVALPIRATDVGLFLVVHQTLVDNQKQWEAELVLVETLGLGREYMFRGLHLNHQAMP